MGAYEVAGFIVAFAWGLLSGRAWGNPKMESQLQILAVEKFIGAERTASTLTVEELEERADTYPNSIWDVYGFISRTAAIRELERRGIRQKVDG